MHFFYGCFPFLIFPDWVFNYSMKQNSLKCFIIVWYHIFFFFSKSFLCYWSILHIYLLLNHKYNKFRSWFLFFNMSIPCYSFCRWHYSISSWYYVTATLYHIISHTLLNTVILLSISRLVLGRRKQVAPLECVRVLKQVYFYNTEQRYFIPLYKFCTTNHVDGYFLALVFITIKTFL